MLQLPRTGGRYGPKSTVCSITASRRSCSSADIEIGVTARALPTPPHHDRCNGPRIGIPDLLRAFLLIQRLAVLISQRQGIALHDEMTDRDLSGIVLAGITNR